MKRSDLKICPNCQHVRPDDTSTPKHLCIACGYRQNSAPFAETYAHMQHDEEPEKAWSDSPKTAVLQRLLSMAILIVLLIGTVAYMLKARPISSSTIDSGLAHDPAQGPTDEPPFQFEYRDQTFDVTPVATYELQGLIVSHNNPTGMTDSYHDKNSVDTRDLCVIWGENVGNDDFHDVSFSSGAWTCYFRYPGHTRFNHSQLSNNHLITDNQDIREAISDLRVGDQIKIKGLLVNYRDARYNNWRNSSTTRNDGGNGACEVVFVNDLQLLKRGNQMGFFVYGVSKWLVFLLLLGKFGVFLYEIKQN